MKRDWTNPWTNPVGEALYPVLAWATKFMPKVYDSPKPVAGEEPEPGYQGYKLCKDCDKVTLHREYRWVTEDETTLECDHCGGVFLGEL